MYHPQVGTTHCPYSRSHTYVQLQSVKLKGLSQEVITVKLVLTEDTLGCGVLVEGDIFGAKDIAINTL